MYFVKQRISVRETHKHTVRQRTSSANRHTGKAEIKTVSTLEKTRQEDRQVLYSKQTE